MMQHALPESFLRPVNAGEIFHPADFPEIRTIQDIHPHLRPNEGIHLFDHDPFLVLRYTSAIPGTFQTAHDLEARSLMFDKDSGELLSRPFHKFFNLGERAGLSDICFAGGPGRLATKLDGSMIAGFVHKGDVVFHTRGGVSRQAMTARATAAAAALNLVRDAFEAGFTPIFEWVSPDNRIIIPYERDALVLLSLRNRVTGDYAPEVAAELARRHGLTLAPSLQEGIASVEDLLGAHATLVDREDIEGAVLVMPNGLHLKLKTRGYLRRHKILANLGNERYAYQAWLEDVVDDTAAALGGARGQALVDFASEIEAAIATCAERLSAQAAELAPLDGKARAAAVRQAHDTNLMQGALFCVLRGENLRESIRSALALKVSQPERRDLFKTTFGLPDWTVRLEDLS